MKKRGETAGKRPPPALSSSQKKFLAAGAMLLLFALFAAQGQSLGVVDSHQLFNFHLHYGEGYVHRGFVGHIVRFFFGEVDNNWVRQNIPRFENFLLLVNISVLWLLLVPRIALAKNISAAARLLLFAFAAVVLLAPVWREQLFHLGFMDKYFYFFVLLAMGGFILKKPAASVVLMAIALLIHRGAIFFALSVSLMALHAVWQIPAYRRQWRRWIGVAGAPLVVWLAQHWLADDETARRLLTDLGKEKIVFDTEVLMRVTFASGGKSASLMFAGFMSFPYAAILDLLLYVAPALALAILLPLSVQIAQDRGRGGFSDDANLGETVKTWAIRLLPAAITASSLPVNIFAQDWARFLYWAWPLFALALVYYVWRVPFADENAAEEKKKLKNRNKQDKRPLAAAGALFALAYMYGGAPLLVSHLAVPVIFPCQKWCLPGVTDNPLGKWYADIFSNWQVRAPFPAKFDGAQIRQVRLISGDLHRTELRGGNLWIPANFDKKIHGRRVSVLGGAIIHAVVNYKTDAFVGDAPPVLLVVQDNVVAPVAFDNHSVRWRLPLPNNISRGAILNLSWRAAENNPGFELIDIELDVVYDK